MFVVRLLNLTSHIEPSNCRELQCPSLLTPLVSYTMPQGAIKSIQGSLVILVERGMWNDI